MRRRAFSRSRSAEARNCPSAADERGNRDSRFPHQPLRSIGIAGSAERLERLPEAVVDRRELILIVVGACQDRRVTQTPDSDARLMDRAFFSIAHTWDLDDDVLQRTRQ